MEYNSWLNMSTKHQDILDAAVELLRDPAWRSDRDTDVQTFLSVPGITSKEQLPGKLKTNKQTKSSLL